MKKPTPQIDDDRQLLMFDDIKPAPVPTKPAPKASPKPKPAEAPRVTEPVPAATPAPANVNVTLQVSIAAPRSLRPAGSRRRPASALDPAARAKKQRSDRECQARRRKKKEQNGLARLEAYIPKELDARVRAQVASEPGVDLSRWVSRELERSLARLAPAGPMAVSPSLN